MSADHIPAAFARVADSTALCRLLHLDACESTQAVAGELIAAGASPYTVVLTNEQTAGYGTHGRRWLHQGGNGLAVSVIVPCPPRVDHEPWVTVAAAVACAQALRGVVLPPPRLKWPNDIVIAQRKVGGVLAELVQEPRLMIIGLGLNLHSAPETDPALPATAAAPWSTQTIRREQILESWLLELYHLLTYLKRGRVDVIREAWHLLLDTTGRRVTVTLDGQELTGLATAVDSKGALIVRPDGGGTIRVQPGGAAIIRHISQSTAATTRRRRSRPGGD
ncbi:MAG: biotin--[acetyl-CoA-carboxylase] ligase [Chloroflexi bacterium]|nr:biotin--[acetyl-CoA-carboxylase] ligase [Chloroflexota bacterium]